jgi:uncharacterized membrane protein YdbT with pleckstrin-like domain
MGYVEQVLQPDERLIETTRIHWWFVWRRTLLLIILAAAMVAFALTQDGDARTGLLSGAALAAVVAMLLAVGPAITRASTELAVTDKRVIHKTGFIRRHTIEISRSQVESVDVDQSVLGRMLNFGDIVVRGTGATPEPFRYIADPLRFRSAINAR